MNAKEARQKADNARDILKKNQIRAVYNTIEVKASNNEYELYWTELYPEVEEMLKKDGYIVQEVGISEVQIANAAMIHNRYKISW